MFSVIEMNTVSYMIVTFPMLFYSYALEIFIVRAGKMMEQLRALAVLADNWGSNPSTHMTL